MSLACWVESSGSLTNKGRWSNRSNTEVSEVTGVPPKSSESTDHDLALYSPVGDDWGLDPADLAGLPPDRYHWQLAETTKTDIATVTSS